jgi:hypothetical protein
MVAMPVGLEVYMLVHVMLSVFGIAAGFVVVGGFIAGVRFSRWVDFFLATTLLTNLTGFGFPFTTLQPAHIVGAVGSFVLLGAISAAYWKHYEGHWMCRFVVLSVVALYLNVFVLITQLLQKIPALAALAPTPQTPVFAAMQGLILVFFIVMGWAAVRGAARMR